MVDTTALAHRGYVEGFAALAEPLASGEVRRRRATVAVITGAPDAFFNSIFIDSASATAGDLDDAITELDATGLPYCVRIARGRDDELKPLLESAGFRVTEEGATPAMVKSPISTEFDAAGLDIQAGAAVYDDHLDVVAAGFGMDRGVLEAVMTPRMTEDPRITILVGYGDAGPVATGFGVTLDGLVVVFSVATLDGHRGRGYGGALTMAAVAAGATRGATVATLQSSAMGYSLYETLGFETAATYDMWVKK